MGSEEPTPPFGTPAPSSPNALGGHTSEPGFAPPPTTGRFSAQQLQRGPQPAPQPTSPPAPAGHQTPTTDQYQVADFNSTGFTSVERLTGQFSADALQQHADAQQLQPGSQPPAASSQHERFTGQFTIPTGPVQQVDSEEELKDMRIRYGIWGAAIGAIVGIIMGVLNSFFEGAYPSPGQTPMIVLTMLGLFVGGGACAYAPRTIEQILRDNDLIKD